MNISSHINSLIQKHLKIEQSIKIANDNFQNDATIKSLKKQKLLLKEKITRLKNNLA